MNYKILEKFVPNGRNIGALIEVDGEELIADITYKSFMGEDGYEFAVFRTKDRQITFDTALPIFCKKNVHFDWDEWERCMNEYVSMKISY